MVGERLEDAAVCCSEETGVKKATRLAGVARQDTGTAGRIHNSPVVVFFSDASPHGQTLIDCGCTAPFAD